MKNVLLRKFVLEFNKARQTVTDNSINRWTVIAYILIYHLEMVSILNHESCRTGKGFNQYSRVVTSHFHIQTLSETFHILLNVINAVAFGYIMIVVAALLREIHSMAQCQRRKDPYQRSTVFAFVVKHGSYISRYLLLVPVLQTAFLIIMQNKVQVAGAWDVISEIIVFPNIVLILLLNLINEFFSFPPAFGDQSLIPRSHFGLTLFELTLIVASTAVSAAQVIEFKYAQIASYLLLALFASEAIWLISHVRYYCSHLHKSSLFFNAVGTMYCVSYVVKILNLEGSTFTELPLLLISPLIYTASSSLFQQRLKRAFEIPVKTGALAKGRISTLELLAFYTHLESQDDAVLQIQTAQFFLQTTRQTSVVCEETKPRLVSLFLQDRARKTVLSFIDAVFSHKLLDNTYQHSFSMEDMLLYISFLASMNFQEVQALELIALASHKIKKEELSFIQYCQLESFEESLEKTMSARRTNQTLSINDVSQAVRQSLTTKKCMREYLDSKLKFMGALLEPVLHMKMLSKEGRKLLEDEEEALAQIGKGTESLESRHIARIFVLDVLENNDALNFNYKYHFVLKAQKLLELELSHRSIAQLDFKLAINSLESTSKHRVDMFVRSNDHQEEGDLKKINEKFLVSLGYSLEDHDRLDFNAIMPGYFPTSKASFKKEQHESVGTFFAREKQGHMRSFEAFRVFEVMNSDVVEVYYMRRNQDSVSRYILLKDNGVIIGVSGMLGKVFEDTGVLAAINHLEGRSIDDILITDHSLSVMSSYDEKSEDSDHLGYVILATEKSTKDWINGNTVKAQDVRLQVLYRMARIIREDGAQCFMITINITRGLTKLATAESGRKMIQTLIKDSTQASGNIENVGCALDPNMHFHTNQVHKHIPSKHPFDDVMEDNMRENIESLHVPVKFHYIGCDGGENERSPSAKGSHALSADKPIVATNTKIDDMSKSGAIEKIHKLEPTSIHSSRSSSQTHKIKELRGSLTNVKLPLVLKVLHGFGFFVTFSLITLIVADYLMINQKVGDLATFSDLATYPSTLLSMMNKFHAYSELAASVDNSILNNSLYTPEFSDQWMPLIRSSIKDVFRDFLTTYMNKAVNLGPEDVSPDFFRSNFNMDLYVGDKPSDRRVGLHEAIEVASVYMQSVSDSINKSHTTYLTDIEFLRLNIINYSKLFNEVSDTLFSQLFTNFDVMSDFLNGIFIAGILLPVALVIIFICIYLRFEEQEEDIISVFAKIPDSSILPEIERLSKYKVFFTDTLVNKSEYQIRERKEKALAPHSKEQKSQRSQSSKTFEKNSTTPFAMAIISLLYVLAYSVIFIPLFTRQKARTAGMRSLLMEQKNLVESYKSFSTVQSVWMQTLSYASSRDHNTTFAWMNQTASAYGTASGHHSILSDLFLGSSEIWRGALIFNELKMALDILSDGDLCTLAPNSTLIAEQCPTVFNGITSRGLLGGYMKYLETTETFRNMLSANFSSTTPLGITRSETFMSDWTLWSAIYSIFDPVLATFDQNLQKISNVSSQQMNLFIIIGMVIYVFLYFASWMPLLIWIQNRYRISRKLLTILPSTILMKNAYIKNLLKKT